MKTITNKTRIIFLAVLASLISIIYIFSQSKSEVLSFEESKFTIMSDKKKMIITSDIKKQINDIKTTNKIQVAINKNITTEKQTDITQNRILKATGKQKLAADALPPQPLPEGHEVQNSRQHQNMPPPAPDSKYAINHQHTNRPDIGEVEKH